MTERIPHILIAGGGTGGHVYPAIAIADAIRDLHPEARVVFAGTHDRLEAKAVPKAGYAFHPITIAGFQRSLSMRNLTFPLKLVKGLVQSWRLVESIEPNVAVGTGGYVSGPVLLAARLQGCPIVVQEQNAYAGVTNRLLSRLAERVHVAFPEVADYVPAPRTVLSGNPTRKALQDVSRDEARRHYDIPGDARVLFVFGGSLGSQAINTAMEKHLSALLEDDRVHILWQTGSRYIDEVDARVKPHPRLRLMEYIDRMDLAYASADLALCRAGAITCSELMVTGTPAVLVPSPNVTADHQTKNAQSMAKAGAARLMPEEKLDHQLLTVVSQLLDDNDARQRMSVAAQALARPDAAHDIARDILRLAGFSAEASSRTASP